MSPTQLLTYFDRIAEAPRAVPRLREFIFDLAVRGRLVDQDPNDEPAADLIRGITTQGRELATGGRSAKRSPLPVVAEEEAPFEVPASWQWTRIRQVTGDRGQTIPDRDFTYIDVTSVDNDAGRLGDISAAEAPTRARKLVNQGDVIYSCVRPYLLNIAIVDRVIEPSPIASTAFAILAGFGVTLPAYLWVALRSPFMIEYVKARMRGQAYPAINDSDFALLPLPLPPLAEQHRIVRKVNELTSLCDRLEAAQAERDHRRTRLEASCSHPTNVAVEQGARVHFHVRQMHRLLTKPQHVGALRRQIVSLAIQGQLVSRAERDSLLTLSATLNSKRRNSIPTPEHWTVTSLDEIADSIVDCPHSTPKWTAAGTICVRTNQFRPGRLDLSHVRFVSEATYRQRIVRLRPTADDILYSREGGILGVACRIPPNIDLCLGQRMMLIRAGEAITPAFLELILNSPQITEIARAKTTGGAAPRINVATVKDYPIPVPPLAEQRRIVEKIDELMAVCDQLEVQLATAQTARSSLLEAVLKRALDDEAENLRTATYSLPQHRPADRPQQPGFARTGL